ncbi:MAG TPA: hypothetical protein PLX04_02625 [Caldisericia bacterium]|nr:hypothetical protein [Caldisericia bacterium]HOU08173.1 hypothetical protein [Caldisericia bacterium]HPL89144.1 hypothetical protein [Caldisericia bacterium]HQG59827.1 hypothetical protein [Caldisericia bacterium]HQH49269.1 hypothetical protein [Caldisericia bacterium]
MDTRYYKGDQNLSWDALLVAKALLDLAGSATFFIQDEKLGTADYKLEYNSKFALTTDYCGKLTGAVWIHQDTSSGPFYALPVEPYIYKRFGFSLKGAIDSYERVAKLFGMEKELGDLGINLRPGQMLRGLTEGERYVGIVPTTQDEKSISSYRLADDSLLERYYFMFLACYRGALQSVSREKWPDVKVRAKKILGMTKDLLSSKPEATISDLQETFWRFGFSEFFNIAPPKIMRASEVFDVKGEINHIVLLTLLRNTKAFVESYNEALNKTHLPLKRLKLRDGVMELPYYIECEYEGRLVRWHIRAHFGEKLILKMTYRNAEPKTMTISNPPSLDELKNGLVGLFGCHTLIGKAGPLLAELSRPPKVISLPEQGSKYAPMVGHLTKELQSRGINYPSGEFLRIGLRAIDTMELLGDEEIFLPPFLKAFWGEARAASWIARHWKEEATAAKEMLESLHFDEGQLLTLAKYAIYEYEDALPNPVTPKMTKLGNIAGISKPLTARTYAKLKELIETREVLLSERREKMADFQKAEELLNVEMAIKLVSVGILKRFEQLTSLFYVNNRPYAISFYLAFGPEIINRIAQGAITRREPC